MAIVIKEIQVKVTVEAGVKRHIDEETLLHLKKEIMKEVKETLRRERIKNER